MCLGLVFDGLEVMLRQYLDSIFYLFFYFGVPLLLSVCWAFVAVVFVVAFCGG